MKPHPLISALWALCLAPCFSLAQQALAPMRPLRVMLVPSDGGTEDGTKADFQPLFDAVSRDSGYTFEIKVGQSYGTVIEALSEGLVDVAYLGTIAFLTAQERGNVEMLALSVTNGSPYYYSGLFTLERSGIRDIAAMKGRSLALSDTRSSSGFVYPLSLLRKSGVEPLEHFSRIILTGSHMNSLSALSEGRIDVCAAPFESYLKAVREGVVDPRRIRIIAKSDPIPNPPIAVNGRLPEEVRSRLRQSLNRVHTMPGILPGMIRGHGGSIVDRYSSEVPGDIFDLAKANLALIDDNYCAQILKKAGQ